MRRVLVLAFVSIPCLASIARAQVQPQWLETYDATPTGSDQVRSTALAPSGSVYAIGQTGADDALILKYDASGNLAWAHTFALAGGIDYFNAAIVDPSDESVYAIGRGDLASTEGLAVKYDASGNLLWSAHFIEPAGNVEFALGRLRANGDLVVAAEGPDVNVVLEYDAHGNLVWSTDAPGGDYPYDLAIDSGGNVVTCGAYDEVNGTAKFGVTKLSPTGALLWQTYVSAGGAGYESAKALAIDHAGSIYVGGRIVDPMSGSNAALAKLDASGNVIWTRLQHGTDPGAGYLFSYLKGVTFAPDGNIRAIGEVVDAGTAQDIIVLEYTPDGQLAWRSIWDNAPSGYDIPVALHTENDGSLTVVAHTVEPNQTDELAVLRFEPHGGLRWSSIQTLSATQPAHVASVAFAPGGVHFLGGWTPGDAFVAAVRDQAVAFCFGDGSSAVCPCGNQAAHGEGQGCPNSLGSAARLTDAGVASLSNDTLKLTASGETAHALSIFVQGDAEVAPHAFGDGLLCVGGNLERLFVQTAQSGTAIAPAAGDPSFSARSAALGDTLAIGSVRFYQVYYRDASAGFCPPPAGSTFNASSAASIAWAQ